MAARSGDRVLDQAVARFVREERYRGDWPDAWEQLSEDGFLSRRWGTALPFDKFAHPGVSEGMCYLIATQLRDYLQAAGLAAAIAGPEGEVTTWRTWRHFGYKNRTVGIAPEHHLVLVERPRATYAVDLTASQFLGQATEFPLFLRLEEGRWLREWTVSTKRQVSKAPAGASA